MPGYVDEYADYFRGLENLRNIIHIVEDDVDQIRRDFFQDSEGNVDKYEEHIKMCNSKFLYCISKLRKNRKKLQVVDSEVRLVSLVNDVRQLAENGENIEEDAIIFLTEFWEQLKDTVSKIKTGMWKFKTSVWTRLQSSCGSYHSGQTQLTVMAKYTTEVQTFTKDIQTTLNKTEQLLRSFEGGLQQDLFDDFSFAHNLLIGCDQKAFPVLRLIPDATEKLVKVCQCARQWIEQDERYVYEISKHIHDARNNTRKKEQDLHSQKVKHTEYNHSVTHAFELFSTNKKRLNKLETEMKVLEQQISQHTQSTKYKQEEKRQKEGIMDFLEISISQTKKNYTLQLKRTRLQKQLQELEESLKQIEEDRKTLEQTMKDKTIETEQYRKQVEKSDQDYQALKTEFENFNNNLEQLEKEVLELSDYLTQLEIICTIKTSPEKVDDFFDRPSTIKLAPSLREKIQQRKRRFATKGEQY